MVEIWMAAMGALAALYLGLLLGWRAREVLGTERRNEARRP
jgi:hypothetical protein